METITSIAIKAVSFKPSQTVCEAPLGSELSIASHIQQPKISGSCDVKLSAQNILQPQCCHRDGATAHQAAIPIIIVIRWRSRPTWSILTASLIYVLPMFLLLIFSVIGGYQRSTGIELFLFFLIFMVIYLIIGLLFLAPIQRKTLNSRKRRLKDKIDTAF